MTAAAPNLEGINFGDNGLVPVVVQNAASGQVLMLAYANKEAVERTLADGFAWFYSRSRRELWKKGATSSNLQRVRAVRTDCDADALLYLVDPMGPACHTGAMSCFYQEEDSQEPASWREDTLTGDLNGTRVLSELFRVIQRRQENPPEGSYVAALLEGPESGLLRKIGEEATEVMLAAVEPGQPDLVPEAADLLFHTLVVLVRYGYSLDDLMGELRLRRK